MKESGMFVISDGNTYTHDYAYYSSHGEFQGEQDVVSLTNMANAKKFFTQEAAELFIKTELPEYYRGTFKAVPMSRLDLLMNCPADYAKLLEWEQKRTISKVTFCINPEDSKNIDIVTFYGRLAAFWGLDSENVRYDCTKIVVSKNIQDNIFETLERKNPDPLYSGMIWVNCGPKTEKSFPADTVELFNGFFITDEKSMPFSLTINKQSA